MGRTVEAVLAGGAPQPRPTCGQGSLVYQELSTRNNAQELLFRNHKALVPQPFLGATFQWELGEDPAEQVGAVLGVTRAKRCRKDGQSPAPTRPGEFLQQPRRSAQPGHLDTGRRRRPQERSADSISASPSACV